MLSFNLGMWLSRECIVRVHSMTVFVIGLILDHLELAMLGRICTVSSMWSSTCRDTSDLTRAYLYDLYRQSICHDEVCLGFMVSVRSCRPTHERA